MDFSPSKLFFTEAWEGLVHSYTIGIAIGLHGEGGRGSKSELELVCTMS